MATHEQPHMSSCDARTLEDPLAVYGKLQSFGVCPAKSRKTPFGVGSSGYVSGVSDADDQMGGTRGPAGPEQQGDRDQQRPEPAAPERGMERAVRDEEGKDHEDGEDRASKDSFPASDPPANY
jgi:hypothetical protein